MRLFPARFHLYARTHPLHLSIVALLLLSNVLGLLFGAGGGFAAHDRLVALYGPHGLVQPPLAAQAAHGVSGDPARRALGFTPAGPRVTPPTARGFGAASLPQAMDLSQNDPPTGDQGAIESCVSWATGYYLRGWYARRDGRYPGGGFNPMSLYHDASSGQNVPTSFEDTFSLLQRDGVDPSANYAATTQDYAHVPTAPERAAALPWRAQGYVTLFNGQGQGYAAQQAIEASIAAGNPVVIGIPIYPSVEQAGPGSYFIDAINGPLLGGHAVFASRYDANGVWVHNQWGTSWGLNGWAELSWGFVQRLAYEALALRLPLPLVAPPAPMRPTPVTPPDVPPHPAPHSQVTLRPTVRPMPHPAPRVASRPMVTPALTGRVLYRLQAAHALRQTPIATSRHLARLRAGWHVYGMGPVVHGWRHVVDLTHTRSGWAALVWLRRIA